MCTDVIHLSRPASFDHCFNCRTVIIDKNPVPHVQPIPVDRDLFLLQAMEDGERDQLLRKLVRAIVIRGSGDIDRKSIR